MPTNTPLWKGDRHGHNNNNNKNTIQHAYPSVQRPGERDGQHAVDQRPGQRRAVLLGIGRHGRAPRPGGRVHAVRGAVGVQEPHVSIAWAHHIAGDVIEPDGNVPCSEEWSHKRWSFTLNASLDWGGAHHTKRRQ